MYISGWRRRKFCAVIRHKFGWNDHADIKPVKFIEIIHDWFPDLQDHFEQNGKAVTWQVLRGAGMRFASNESIPASLLSKTRTHLQHESSDNGHFSLVYDCNFTLHSNIQPLKHFFRGICITRQQIMDKIRFVISTRQLLFSTIMTTLRNHILN